MTWAGLATVVTFLGSFGAWQWIGPALLKASAFEPRDFQTKLEFGQWEQSHKEWGEAVIDGHETHFRAIEASVATLDTNNKEWRINQAEVNRRILDKLDVIIDRLPSRRADASKEFWWEEACVSP